MSFTESVEGYRVPPPPCLKFLRVYFENFDSITREEGGKKISGPQKLYRAGTAPPVYKILDPPLVGVKNAEKLELLLFCNLLLAIILRVLSIDPYNVTGTRTT